MSEGLLEIRWHGRGGQGAKTAAAMVAEVAVEAGKYAQAAPEYGAEREGAPIR
ncbi:MAG: 2-oxoacid:acceptor oxidoreductase family protein, partial [Planctomycetota bacterium]